MKTHPETISQTFGDEVRCLVQRSLAGQVTIPGPSSQFSHVFFRPSFFHVFSCSCLHGNLETHWKKKVALWTYHAHFGTEMSGDSPQHVNFHRPLDLRVGLQATSEGQMVKAMVQPSAIIMAIGALAGAIAETFPGTMGILEQHGAT